MVLSGGWDEGWEGALGLGKRPVRGGGGGGGNWRYRIVGGMLDPGEIRLVSVGVLGLGPARARLACGIAGLHGGGEGGWKSLEPVGSFFLLTFTADHDAVERVRAPSERECVEGVCVEGFVATWLGWCSWLRMGQVTTRRAGTAARRITLGRSKAVRFSYDKGKWPAGGLAAC